MFDSAPIEVGKVRDGFLTDARNRRIYFPPVGAPRRIPTPATEAKLRENIMWSTGVGWVLFVTAMVALIFVPASSNRGLVFCVFIVVCRLVGASLFARRLPPLDDPTVTHRQAIQETYMQRSYVWLCCAVTLVVLVSIGFSVAPWVLWLLKDWDAESDLDRYLGLYGMTFMNVFFAPIGLYWSYNLITAMRSKLQGRQPRTL